MAAPSAAACWLVPVPTTQMRRARANPSDASWICCLVVAESKRSANTSG